MITAKSLYSTAVNTLIIVKTFDVNFANPCLDTDFVTIVKPADIPTQYYTVFADEESFFHATCYLNAEAISHGLCGSVASRAVIGYDDVEIYESDSPISYTTLANGFDIFSENVALFN